MTAPLFPNEVDWSAPLKVSIAFKTDIIVSRSGKEMRRALRNTPRKSLDFQVTTTGAGVPALHAFLVANQAGAVMLADVTRSIFTVADLPVTTTTVSLGVTPPSWMVAGAVLALYSRPGSSGTGTSGTMTVQSVGPTSVTFTTVGAVDWPAGTRLCPALLGRLKATLSGSHITSTVARAAINFDVTPCSELAVAPPAAPQTFNGRELVLLQPNWGESVGVAHGHDFETLDFGQGVVGYYQPIAYASRVFKATFLGRSQAEMASIEQWFQRAKGRRGEFYMPTWEPDLVLTAPINALDTTITVAGTTIATSYATDTVFRALMILTTTGAQVFCKIVGFATSGGNTIVSLTTGVGVTLAVSAVQMISWMPVWRHATDISTSEWITDGVAQNQLTLQTLEDLTPED